MKTTLALLSLFFFSAHTFWFSFGASTPAPALGASAPAPVLDVAGKKLRTDTYYYILPASIRGKGRGGGLTLDSILDNSCPLEVVQEAYGYMQGTPLKFYPVNLKKGVIRVSTDLNIEFSGPNRCGESNVWKRDDYDQSMQKYFVGVDGTIGNPGDDTLSNWFKIEKFNDAYKLVYCPSVCEDCDPDCEDLGIVYQNGKRRLALNGSNPLKVIFKQA